MVLLSQQPRLHGSNGVQMQLCKNDCLSRRENEQQTLTLTSTRYEATDMCVLWALHIRCALGMELPTTSGTVKYSGELIYRS